MTGTSHGRELTITKYMMHTLSDQSLILGINALSASKTHVASLMLVGISLYIQDAHDLKVIRKTDREYIVYISSPIFHMYLFYVGYGLKHSTVCMVMPSSHASRLVHSFVL